MDTINYIGHRIRARLSELAFHTTGAIRDLQQPAKPSELGSFFI